MSNEFRPVQFTFQPELILDALRVEEGLEYKLFDQNVGDAVLEQVSTKMKVTERQNVRVFNLSSLLRPADLEIYPDIIASDFATIVDEHQDSHHRVDIIKPTSSMGHTRVIDTQNGNIHSMISPLFGGEEWNVETVLDYFKKGYLEPSVVERMFSNHIFILNSLTTAIAELRGEVNIHDNVEDYSNNIIVLSMSGKEARQLELERNQGEQMIPDDVFSSFVGIDDAVSDLKNVIEIAKIPQVEKLKYGVTGTQAVILSGPSGVGKTELATALAKGLEATLEEINYTDLASSSTGEWASNIANIFEAAKNSDETILLFFDEADGLLKTGNPGSNSNIESTLKKELEQLHEYPNVFVVFATNNEASFSPEIRAKKRIQLTIRLEKPNNFDRFSIFDKYLGLPITASSPTDTREKVVYDTLTMFPDFYDFQQLADETEDFTAGDIVSIIKELRTKHYLKNKDTPNKLNSLITQDELMTAIKRARKTREA
jgi:AAA+ superfamily predicted ATPase